MSLSNYSLIYAELDLLKDNTDIKEYIPTDRVKQFIKELENFCNIHKGTLIVADTFLEVIKDKAGKELCE